MTGRERTAAVSPQTELGLGALRVLGHWPDDWEPTQPMILSGLKTWLETGELLTTPGSLLYG